MTSFLISRCHLPFSPYPSLLFSFLFTICRHRYSHKDPISSLTPTPKPLTPTSLPPSPHLTTGPNFFSPAFRSTTNWRTGVTYLSIVSAQTQSRSSKTYSRGHIYTQHWSRWVNSWRTLSLDLSLTLLYTLLP